MENKRRSNRLGKWLRRVPDWGLTVVALGLLFWLTLSPKPLPDTDVELIPGLDKVAHALMFGGVYFAIVWDWSRHRNRGKGEKTTSAVSAGMAVTALGITVALGGGIELLQGAMALGRGCEWGDFVADCIGAAAAVWVTQPVLRWLE